MPLSLEDRMAIHEMLSLYGHLIDARQFSRLAEIFTEDAVFDLSGYGGKVYSGLAAITQMMLDSDEHPLAHHATNVVILEESAAVSALSKGLGLGAGGRAGSVTYRDQLRHTDQGWRISIRCCDLRSTESIPPPS